MSSREAGRVKAVRKHLVPAVLALVLAGGGCLDSPTDGLDGVSQLALDLTVATPPGAPALSTEEALQKVDRVAIEIRSTDDESLVFETEVAVDPADDELVVPLSIQLGGGVLDARVTVRLRSGSDALFAGSAAATLRAGPGDPVEVEVDPIPDAVAIGPVGDPLEVDQVVELQGAVLFATGDAIDGLTPVFSTLDPEVVDVTPEGTLTALARGEARVRASFEALTETVTVLVGEPVIEVTVEPSSASIRTDEEILFTATPRDAAGQPIPGDLTASWMSSRPEVADVDPDGRATGLTEGTTEITATIEGVTGTAQLAVTRPDLVVSSGPPSVPAQVVRGGTVTFTQWRVRNDGSAAGAFSVGFFLSADAQITADDMLLGQAPRSGGLAAGAETVGTNTVPVPVDLGCGTYFLGILADDEDDVGETDETNNAVASTTEIIGCDAPVISNVLPSPELATGPSFAFAGDGTTEARSILFRVSDPDGNLASVTVDAVNSDDQVTPLPTTVDGDEYRADPDAGLISGSLPDDRYDVVITATDELGLVSTVEISYRLDRTPPGLLNFAPPPTSGSAESSTAELSMSSSIFDSGGFRLVTVAIFEDGDGNCSTLGDQTALAEPGEVDDQSRDVTADAATANFFDEMFTLFFPGSGPVNYCTILIADDGAVSNTGAPLPNRRVERSPTAFVWF